MIAAAPSAGTASATNAVQSAANRVFLISPPPFWSVFLPTRTRLPLSVFRVPLAQWGQPSTRCGQFQPNKSGDARAGQPDQEATMRFVEDRRILEAEGQPERLHVKRIADEFFKGFETVAKIAKPAVTI